MKMKFFTLNEKNNIELTKEELEALMNEIYESGYADAKEKYCITNVATVAPLANELVYKLPPSNVCIETDSIPLAVKLDENFTKTEAISTNTDTNTNTDADKSITAPSNKIEGTTEDGIKYSYSNDGKTTFFEASYNNNNNNNKGRIPSFSELFKEVFDL